MGEKNRQHEMKVICAWCGEELGEKNGEGVKGVSHGVCQECLRKLNMRLEKEVKDGAK